jgi:hypothetical protein
MVQPFSLAQGCVWYSVVQSGIRDVLEFGPPQQTVTLSRRGEERPASTVPAKSVVPLTRQKWFLLAEVTWAT